MTSIRWYISTFPPWYFQHVNNPKWGWIKELDHKLATFASNLITHSSGNNPTVFHQYFTANNWKITFLWPPFYGDWRQRKTWRTMRFGVTISQGNECSLKLRGPLRIHHFRADRHSFCILELNSNPAKFSDKTYTGISAIRLTLQKEMSRSSDISVGRILHCIWEDQHSPHEQIIAVIGDWHQRSRKGGINVR